MSNRTATVLALSLAALIGVTGNVHAAKRHDAETVIVVFRFYGSPDKATKQLPDSIQLRLRRNIEHYLPTGYVVSPLEIENLLGSMRPETVIEKLPDSLTLIAQRLGLSDSQKLFVLTGTVNVIEYRAKATATYYALKNNEPAKLWTKNVADEGERWKKLLSDKITDACLDELNITHPLFRFIKKKVTYTWGENLLKNGDFEKGNGFSPDHWDTVDGLVSHWAKSPKGTGMALMYDTHILLDQALDWWKKLKAGADPRKAPDPIRTNPPHYNSVGGTYGGKLYSDYIEIKPPAVFKIKATLTGPKGGDARCFVKGYAMLPRAKSDELQPREVWRTYLHCPIPATKHKTFEMEFRVPKELPKVLKPVGPDGKKKEVWKPEVKWLRVMPYAMWPVGKYYWDNIELRLGTPLDEKPDDNPDSRPHAQHPPENGKPQK